jgi:tetratricopeptide (TPR) repeat protein
VRRRTTALVASAAAVALALGGLVGGVFAEQSASRAAAVDPRAPAGAALAGPAGGTGMTAATVAQLEAEARARPSDAPVLVQLGLAYQQRWRETADPSYLPRSEVALRRALGVRPDEPNAVLGLGSLALIRHEFEDALAYGKRARPLLPGSGRPYGVVGDALVELGRYDEAFAAFQRMVTLRPNLASYARVAYARELTGDLEGALAAMRLARDAAGGRPESTAFTLVEIAKLELTLGRRGMALRDARLALRVLPGYPAARLAVARIEAARGRLGAAIRQARRASEAIPSAEAVMLYSDLLDRAGKSGEARRQRATVAVIDRLLEASGVGVDLESAVHRSDLRIRPGATVRLARRARAARPSIYGDDALAWALARAGSCREALPYAERSLRLGTRDALLYFHRGYAEGCAGDEAAMREWYERALALNPEFSLRWAPVARAALGR